MKQRVLKVHPADNVIVALQDLRKGEPLYYLGKEHVPADDIHAKHKFFEKDMQPGERVVMYGVLVGTVQRFIPKGGLMTTENVKHAADPFVYRPSRYRWTPAGRQPFCRPNVQRLPPRRRPRGYRQLLALYSYRFLREPKPGGHSRGACSIHWAMPLPTSTDKRCSS